MEKQQNTRQEASRKHMKEIYEQERKEKKLQSKIKIFKRKRQQLEKKLKEHYFGSGEVFIFDSKINDWRPMKYEEKKISIMKELKELQ